MSSAVGEFPSAVRVLDAWEPVVVEGPKERRAGVIAGRQSGRVARWQLLAVLDEALERKLVRVGQAVIAEIAMMLGRRLETAARAG